VQHDFRAQVQNVLLVSGTVRDPQSVPLGGALLRLESPELYETRTDPSGAYTLVLALPDGVTHGVLQLAAFAADSSSTARASQPFRLDGPGLHSVELDVQMQATPGALPPFSTLRRVLVTGTVTDQLAAQQDGSTVPLGNLQVNVTSPAFAAGSTCGSVITAADGSYQCIAVLGDGSAFTVNVGTQLPGQTATLAVPADAVPQLGQMTTLTQDLSVSPATLLLTGTVDTAQRVLAGAAIDVTASSGEAAHAVTGADGAYRVYLPLTTPGTQSPLLGYAISLGGPALTVQQAVTARPGVLTRVQQNARFATGTAVITGRVVDALAGAAPVAGAHVAAIDALGHVACQAVTSATGTYGCAVFTSGSTIAVYDLQVSGRGAATFAHAASVNQSQISAGQVRAKGLQEMLTADESLFSRGIISRLEVAQARADHDRTMLDIANARARTIEVEELAGAKRGNIAELERQKQEHIDALQAEASRLQVEVSLGSMVKAPVAGRIEEIRVGQGDVVAPGTIIATIGRVAPEAFEVVAVFDNNMAKRITAGLDVHVHPSSVRREEHGAMRGRGLC